MSQRTTKIQWTDRTVNPFRAHHVETMADGHWCQKVSPGCANCYASEWNTRVRPHPSGGISIGTGLPFDVRHRSLIEPYFDPDKLLPVVRRTTPTLYFWCDMTDFFGDWNENAWRDDVIATAVLTPWHGHQIVTKRSEAARAYFNDPTLRDRVAARAVAIGASAKRPADAIARLLATGVSFANVWLLASVENQSEAERRIPHLLTTEGVGVRGLSVEPLLDRVDLANLDTDPFLHLNALTGVETFDEVPAIGPSIDWVIVGGESGHKARPCNVGYVRDLVEQCRAASVPCFVKQLGSRPVASDGVTPVALKDRKGGDPSEWLTPFVVRQLPRVWTHARPVQ